MEIHNKRKLLRAPPNLTLAAKRDQEYAKNGVSSCNLSRIADKTQRTEFKEEESILNDLGAFLNTKRQADNDDDANQQDRRDSLVQEQYHIQQPKQFQLQSIYQQYERALEILTNQVEPKTTSAYSFYKAFQILNSLIQAIKYQRQKDLKYELAENIVLNYWKLGNDLFVSGTTHQNESYSKTKPNKYSIEQKQRQQITENFRSVFPLLEDLLIKQQIKTNKLTILALIMSKEYFRDKDMGKALEWCEKAFKHCPKFKNTSILLKLHYMKSKIYNEIHANEPEFQQIKKCIFYLKALSQNTTQNKQFSQELMKTLVKRRDELKAILYGTHSNEGYKQQYNKSTEKASSHGQGVQKSLSMNKFRKRSISFTKLKTMNEDCLEKQNPNLFNVNFKKSLQKDFVTTTQNTMSNQTKKEFLKLDINRKTKLKKKGQTLTIWEKNSEKITFENKIAKELEKASVSGKGSKNQNRLWELMLRRPNDKKNTNLQTGEGWDRGAKTGMDNQAEDEVKEKPYLRNPLIISTSNMTKADPLKQQSHQAEQSQQPPHQSPLQVKNRLAVTTKSDSQLIKYISRIQNDFLTKYFARYLKASTNEGLEDGEVEFFDREEFGQEEYSGHGLEKDSLKKDEPNLSKMKSKVTHEYEDRPIEENSKDSVDSYTKNLVFPDQEDTEKLLFGTIVCRQEKKNSVLTTSGVIDQIHLEVRKNQSLSSGRRSQNQPKTQIFDGFKFITTIVINKELQKTQLNFPLFNEPSTQPLQLPLQKNFEERFHMWIYNSVSMQEPMIPNSREMKDDQLIQSMLKRQSIDTEIDTFLIDKIVHSLCIKRDENLGYRKIHFKKWQRERKSDDEWERESIFQWREKNFQYVKEQRPTCSSRSDFLPLDWHFQTSFSQKQILTRHNHEPEQDTDSFQYFFIQLEKLSSPKVNQSNPCQSLEYLLTRYDLPYAQSFDHKFFRSYVVYNDSKKADRLKEIERQEREIEEGQSFVDVSSLSDTNSLKPLNFSQNPEQHIPVLNDRVTAKIEHMRQVSKRICASFFPKYKYLQLSHGNYFPNEILVQDKQNSLNKKQIIFQEAISSKIDDFIIKIIGIQSSNPRSRKKASVRKSQIIQLQQNLNHSNFLREVLKSKSSFKNQNQPQFDTATDKKSQFMIKTTGEMNQNKESVRMKCRESWMGDQVRIDNVQELSKSAKRKNTEEAPQGSKISEQRIMRILKKALIQPDYKKSTLLMTYFDSLSIKSFFKLMGTHPNYIRLTCFRLKSIYVEDQQSMSFYYLFELQEREARTRMHKFIIGDREIGQLLKERGLEWQAHKSDGYEKIWDGKTSGKEGQKVLGNRIVHRTSRQTKTLPHKKKGDVTGSNSNGDILSDENKPPACVQSVINSHPKPKRPLIESQFHTQPQTYLSAPSHQLSLKFTQQSLTQVIKLITPHIIIKKDYLYTSVCLNSQHSTFYLMNKFTVENDSPARLEGGQKRIACHRPLDDSATLNPDKMSTPQGNQRPQSLKSCLSQNLFKTNHQNQHDKNYFLTEQIKAKKILCQKSIVLSISQNFTESLSKQSKKSKKPPSYLQERQKLKLADAHKQGSKQQKLGENGVNLFAILTIIKISKSKYFTIRLYIPKFQRSYSLTLDKSVMNYLQMKDLIHIFGQFQNTHDILQELQTIWNAKETNANKQQTLLSEANRQKQKLILLQRLCEILFEQDSINQKVYWKKVLSLIKIEEKYTEDKVYLIMKIANFHGFIKDCSFLEFFRKNGDMYMIEMTINKKSQNSQYFPKKNFLQSLPGSKIKRGSLTGPQAKKTKPKNCKFSHPNKRSIDFSHQSKLISAEMINCHNQQFVKMASIYESKADQYTLYVQIFKIYQHDEEKELPLTAKNSISRNFGRTTQKNQDELDSEILGANDSVNQVVHDSPNMSERQSEVSFSDFKPNNRIIRVNTLRNTIKSTAKSFTSQTGQRLTNNNYFSHHKRLKSNYKLINSNSLKQTVQPSNEISKINLSFYLSELNPLFKYVDENYSDDFNEEYFVLSQMTTAFKMLGTMIVEEFKAVSKEDSGQEVRSDTEKKITPMRKKNQETDTNRFKRSGTRRCTNQLSGAQSLIERQVGFEGSSYMAEKQSYQKLQSQQATKQEGVNLCIENYLTVDKLFGQHENQKSFKDKILLRIEEFKEKIKKMGGNPIKEENQSEVSSGIKGELMQSPTQGEIDQQGQTFISLHSRCCNKGLVDVHILSSGKERKVSTLFYWQRSLLFLISNTRRFEVNVMSVRVEADHPLEFIQVLEQKGELGCIRNRLFRFYRNLLTLMGR